jgi:hypothetical protein
MRFFGQTNNDQIIKQPSRNGDVLRLRTPVCITYERPIERVLFDATRDTNPFFHLYESLWMLAGKCRLEPLAYFVPRMSDFSDNGITLNGAYGSRWRYNNSYKGYVDQLELLVDHLKNNPNSRRAILQMWNVEDDLLKIDTSKDVCCNLCVQFEIRTEWCPGNGAEGLSYEEKYLDMTVFNRSNDMILGAFGANVVHFSVLHEYMASKLGITVGVYNQVSSNLHVYTSEKKYQPEKYFGTMYDAIKYPDLGEPMPLVADDVFDNELAQFITITPITVAKYEPFTNKFIRMVQVLCGVFTQHKLDGPTEAMLYLDKREDQVCPYWCAYVRQWLRRRMKKDSNYDSATEK